MSAADGETIILGGLISRSTNTLHRQVPWLGSLPILKHLFSYDFNQTLRTELVIILTPHVVRSQGDMERIKQAEFARMSWCEADIFEIHGDVYPRTDMAIEMTKQDDLDVVYPDIDPRGSRLGPSYGKPTVGPALMKDPSSELLRSPELIKASVEPAVFQSDGSRSRNQALNSQVNTVGAR